jgi:hypothetical protein
MEVGKRETFLVYIVLKKSSKSLQKKEKREKKKEIGRSVKGRIGKEMSSENRGSDS